MVLMFPGPGADPHSVAVIGRTVDACALAGAAAWLVLACAAPAPTVASDNAPATATASLEIMRMIR
jgi:hypothetical protein